jgi:hypothetical protein
VLVWIAIVELSIFSTWSMSLLRERARAKFRGLKAGLVFDVSLSKFQIAASAFQSQPSWNLTSWRSSIIHFFGSSGLEDHFVASAGLMSAQNRLRGGRFRLECQCARRHQQRNQNRGKGLVQIEHYEHLSALNCV